MVPLYGVRSGKAPSEAWSRWLVITRLVVEQRRRLSNLPSTSSSAAPEEAMDYFKFAQNTDRSLAQLVQLAVDDRHYPPTNLALPAPGSTPGAGASN